MRLTDKEKQELVDLANSEKLSSDLLKYNLSDQIKTLLLDYRLEWNKEDLRKMIKLCWIKENDIIVPSFPDVKLDLQKTTEWYDENYPDMWLFDLMKNFDQHQLFGLIDQRLWANAFFNDFLRNIYDQSNKLWKSKLSEAIAMNLQDETWINYWVQTHEEFEWKPLWRNIEEYIRSKYSTNIPYEEYKKMPHSTRRLEMEKWYKKAYEEYLKGSWDEEYKFENENDKNIKLNNWLQVFKLLSQELIKNNNWLESLWAIMFFELTLPTEFKHIKNSQEKLFPNMNYYENTYILNNPQSPKLGWLSSWNLV